MWSCVQQCLSKCVRDQREREWVKHRQFVCVCMRVRVCARACMYTIAWLFGLCTMYIEQFLLWISTKHTVLLFSTFNEGLIIFLYRREEQESLHAVWIQDCASIYSGGWKSRERVWTIQWYLLYAARAGWARCFRWQIANKHTRHKHTHTRTCTHEHILYGAHRASSRATRQFLTMK